MVASKNGAISYNLFNIGMLMIFSIILLYFYQHQTYKNAKDFSRSIHVFLGY